MLLIGLRVVQAQNTTTTINYAYDAAGNRVQRTITITQLKTQQHTNNNDSINAKADDIKSVIAADSNLSQGEGISNNGDIKVFPNPVAEKVNVQFTGTANYEGSSLKIYDGTGKLFLNKEALQQHNEISMQAASKGTYFMVIITKDKKRQYWKLVKE